MNSSAFDATEAFIRFEEDAYALMRLLYNTNRMDSTERALGSIGSGVPDSVICELVFCRTVDQAMAYLTDLLSEIHHAKPERLRNSKETIEVRFALQYSTIEELTHALIARKVEELAFRGIRGLDKYCQELGLQLFVDRVERCNVSFINELRNIFVHNRGIVSRTFNERVCAEQAGGEGTRIPMDQSQICVLNFIFDWLIALDGRAAQKFGLETTPAMRRIRP